MLVAQGSLWPNDSLCWPSWRRRQPSPNESTVKNCLEHFGSLRPAACACITEKFHANSIFGKDLSLKFHANTNFATFPQPLRVGNVNRGSFRFTKFTVTTSSLSLHIVNSYLPFFFKRCRCVFEEHIRFVFVEKQFFFKRCRCIVEEEFFFIL